MHKDGEPQHFFKSSKEKSVHRHEKAKDKALSKKIASSDLNPNRLSGVQKDVLRKKYGTNRLTGSMLDEGRKNNR